jgi:hypothetical protein
VVIRRGFLAVALLLELIASLLWSETALADSTYKKRVIRYTIEIPDSTLEKWCEYINSVESNINSDFLLDQCPELSDDMISALFDYELDSSVDNGSGSSIRANLELKELPFVVYPALYNKHLTLQIRFEWS